MIDQADGGDYRRREWFSIDELAGLLGVTRTQFERRYRRMVGKADEKRSGKMVLLRGRAFLDALVDDRVRRGATTAATNASVPKITVAQQADADYRKAKADLAALQLAKQRGEAVMIDDVREVFDRIASVFRAWGDRLKTDFPELYREWLSTIDAAERELDVSFPGKTATTPAE